MISSSVQNLSSVNPKDIKCVIYWHLCGFSIYLTMQSVTYFWCISQEKVPACIIYCMSHVYSGICAHVASHNECMDPVDMTDKWNCRNKYNLKD